MDGCVQRVYSFVAFSCSFLRVYPGICIRVSSASNSNRSCLRCFRSVYRRRFGDGWSSYDRFWSPATERSNLHLPSVFSGKGTLALAQKLTRNTAQIANPPLLRIQRVLLILKDDRRALCGMACSRAFSLGEEIGAGSQLCHLSHPQARGTSDSPGSENSSFIPKDSAVEVGQCTRKKVKYRSVSSSDTREGAPVVFNDEEEDVVLVRPKLRGKIHLGLLLLSPLWVALLLSACKSLMSIVAASVSCLSFLANFAASALLHCGRWGPEWRHLVVKLDHAGACCFF